MNGEDECTIYWEEDSEHSFSLASAVWEAWLLPFPALNFFQWHLLRCSHLLEVSGSGTTPAVSFLTVQPTIFSFFSERQLEFLLNVSIRFWGFFCAWSLHLCHPAPQRTPPAPPTAVSLFYTEEYFERNHFTWNWQAMSIHWSLDCILLRNIV